MSSENTEHKPRHFLVVVDDTPECRKALRFAARRAHSVDNGGVMLLRVTEPPDFQHWMGVGELMREEVSRVIAEDESVRILVLGASADSSDPGPLVRAFAGELAGSLRIPVTIVPGTLTTEQIDQLS